MSERLNSLKIEAIEKISISSTELVQLYKHEGTYFPFHLACPLSRQQTIIVSILLQIQKAHIYTQLTFRIFSSNGVVTWLSPW